MTPNSSKLSGGQRIIFVAPQGHKGLVDFLREHFAITKLNPERKAFRADRACFIFNMQQPN